MFGRSYWVERSLEEIKSAIGRLTDITGEFGGEQKRLGERVEAVNEKLDRLSAETKEEIAEHRRDVGERVGRLGDRVDALEKARQLDDGARRHGDRLWKAVGGAVLTVAIGVGAWLIDVKGRLSAVETELHQQSEALTKRLADKPTPRR